MTTRAQIIALRNEAKQAGDYRAADLCGQALAGDEDSVRECERVIAGTDPDAQCPEHGCARWRCDADHGDRPSTTILVTADPDEDDCLTAAADAYIAEHPELEGWDLAPRWTDETRERVTLTVPGWHAGGE